MQTSTTSAHARAASHRCVAREASLRHGHDDERGGGGAEGVRRRERRLQCVDERPSGPRAVDDRLHRDRHEPAHEHGDRREQQSGCHGRRPRDAAPDPAPRERHRGESGDHRGHAEGHRPEHRRHGGPHGHPPGVGGAFSRSPVGAAAVYRRERRRAGDDRDPQRDEEQPRKPGRHDLCAPERRQRREHEPHPPGIQSRRSARCLAPRKRRGFS